MTFKISVDKRSIENLENLVELTQSIPARIKMANANATNTAVRNIKENIQKRSPSISRAIKVEAQPYGEFGSKIKIYSSGPRGGNTGGRSKKGRYSLVIASRIFLNSEQGKIGRKAFGLPKKTKGYYVISHTSGKWRKGRRLQGPLRIPPIGPYYFSSKSGVKREKIDVMSRKVVKKYLNQYYSGILRRGSRV